MEKTNESSTVEQISDQTKLLPDLIAEMKANMKAIRNQELHGEHVKKVNDHAVVTVDDVVVVLEIPITYPQLLSAIVKRKYNSDRAEAVTANYLKIGSGDLPEAKAAEYTAEYEAYQEWRTKAKGIAKEVMGIEE